MPDEKPAEAPPAERKPPVQVRVPRQPEVKTDPKPEVTPKVTGEMTRTELEMAVGRERLKVHREIAKRRAAAEAEEAASKEAEKAD